MRVYIEITYAVININIFVLFQTSFHSTQQQRYCTLAVSSESQSHRQTPIAHRQRVSRVPTGVTLTRHRDLAVELCLPLFLPLTHTHTHGHARARMHTHAQKLSSHTRRTTKTSQRSQPQNLQAE